MPNLPTMPPHRVLDPGRSSPMAQPTSRPAVSHGAEKMRILMLSGPLHPLIGGLETAADILATQLVALGQEVTVATLAQTTEEERSAYRVIRRPSPSALLGLFRWADCVVMQGLTLKLAWPKLFMPTPAVVIHQGLFPSAQRFSWLRNRLAKRVVNVAISVAVGDTIPGEWTLIYNPYDATTFRPQPVRRIPTSLIFVGRLVPEKGLLPLIEALATLRGQGLKCPLTIVGEGPLRRELETAIRQHDLVDQVQLTGSVVGADLAMLFSAHQVAVVPSLWPEPLGIVALEAIACGCDVIGTSQGGLPEAIGPCGTIVPNGDVAALAMAITSSVEKPLPTPQDERQRAIHLRSFHPSNVASKFLDLFHRLTGVSA